MKNIAISSLIRICFLAIALYYTDTENNKLIISLLFFGEILVITCPFYKE